jgi:glutamate dehydrogenase
MGNKQASQNDGLAEALAEQADLLRQAIEQTVRSCLNKALENLQWIFSNIPLYFFITMQNETEAIANLAIRLNDVSKQRRITLVDQDNKLIVAHLDIPGSLYETAKDIEEREISYAELTHSYEPLPRSDTNLEILKFEFERKSHEEIAQSSGARIRPNVKRLVLEAMEDLYPDYDLRDFAASMRLLWRNNKTYAEISPPDRIARALWLYEQSVKHDGLYLDLELVESAYCRCTEYRLLFSVTNPPEKGFMTQISDVFRRLAIGVQRFYILNISTGSQRHFLGTFYIMPRDGAPLKKESALFQELQTELYNTQILSTATDTYRHFVTEGLMGGEEASLTEAFIGFCHTNLAHNQPDRFSLARVEDAFHMDPDTTLRLIDLFKLKFGPKATSRRKEYQRAIEALERSIQGYNTGHRHLDRIRRRIFLTCLSFIRHVLKTNFFVPRKLALAFRLDPSYLTELPPDFISDLPKASPFRISLFFGRHGLGYHIGFSDIARGGWRTVICTSDDSYLTSINTLFREVFVLAHTQHLKNKDIYEGGSKMVVVLNAEDCGSPEEENHRLFKLQYGFINAFLDVFVTASGKAVNPQVIDYYGEDEPIELGPDENMHDEMIETIAQQALRRGYLLGSGIISSKRVGINHKRYGVTSRGVVKFAEIAMKELGTDMLRSPFTVKMTGGPIGDVAGNVIRLLFERFPSARIRSIVDGAGALYDPKGANKQELRKLILHRDVVHFNPRALHAGGFIIFREENRQAQLRILHRKLIRTNRSVEEHWITADEFQRQIQALTFDVSADIFLPCGGRPETIDGTNWQEFCSKDGTPSAQLIVEGANSFITPEAREELERRGVIILRDASANKCGVIASSYEIIANLLMTEKEFFHNKDAYVNSVMKILDKRVQEEADLIFRRFHESGGKKPCTEITNQISKEINTHYSRLVALFQDRPQLPDSARFRKVLLNHLPGFIRENSRFKARVKHLPPKIKIAILASELASFIVYHGGWEWPLESKLDRFVKQHFS